MPGGVRCHITSVFTTVCAHGSLREPTEGVESTKGHPDREREGRVRRFVLLCAIGAISAGSALAQTADDRALCAKRQGDESIEACTREIASGTLSGRDLANTHYNRAVAQRTKRAQDLALPDLDTAIQVDPSVAAYFLVRARVWVTKNDLDRAMADLDEAI